MTARPRTKRIVVGISGASGGLYARRLIERLCAEGVHVDLIVTPHGARVLRDELGIPTVSADTLLGGDCGRLVIHSYDDVGAAPASGSLPTDGMIVCPCSGNRLASMAAGLADNLLDRAAAVTLKEGRRLVVVPREMPISRIDLGNALRLSEAGAIICPASPGFYLEPQSIADLVDFVVGRLLDLLGVPHSLATRWADRLEGARTTPRRTPDA